MNAKAFLDLQEFERRAEALAMDPSTYSVDAHVIETLRNAGVDNREIQLVVFQQREPEEIETARPRLDANESDRAYRLARVVVLANRVFGDTSKAFMWLRMKNATLGGNTPIASLQTETGSRLVEELLIRIDHGIAA